MKKISIILIIMALIALIFRLILIQSYLEQITSLVNDNEIDTSNPIIEFFSDDRVHEEWKKFYNWATGQ